MSTSVLNELTSVVIGLESCNILLFLLLVLTPVPKHSLVRSLIICCLTRSVLDIIMPITYKIIPNTLNQPDIGQHLTMVSLCVADSILLRYVTVVKAAFAVSFTLPCLYLVLVQVRPKRSADDYPRLTKNYVMALCIGPFVWALPVLMTPIRRVVQQQSVVPNSITFNITSCYFDDPAFSIVSLVFTLIPLAVAVAVSAVMAVVVWKYSDTMLNRSGWLFVKTARFARFAALVFVTMVSAALYAMVLARWSHDHSRWPGDPLRWLSDHGWVRMVRSSVIWEAITPLLFFVIFSAQEEIYETWLGWLSRFIAIPRKKRDGRCRDSLQLWRPAIRGPHVPGGDLATGSAASHPADQKVAARWLPALPGKIVPRPLSSSLSHQQIYTDLPERRPHRDSARSGLPPPPRRKPLGARALEDTPRMSRYRFPFLTGPSLRTFGSQASVQIPNTRSSFSEPFGMEGNWDVRCAEGSSERVPTRDGSRSETPGSVKTFRRSEVGRQ